MTNEPMTNDRSPTILTLFFLTLLLGAWRQGLDGYFSATALAQAEPENRPALERSEGVIKSIVIKGNERIDTSTIKAAIKLKKGDLYSPRLVNEDVLRIYDLGYFDNIHVLAPKQKEGGLQVVFVVRERPIVNRIIFKGNNKLKTKKLRESIQLKENDYLNKAVLRDDERALKQLYRDKGHQFIEVKANVVKVERTDGKSKERSLSRVDVIYNVHEGPKAKVKKILFEGNTAFSDRKLASLMETKRRRLILSDGIYDEDDFQDDLLRIKEHYHLDGWLDAVVGGYQSYDDKKENIYLTIRIKEGERYQIDDVLVSGNELFPTETLTSELKLQKGSAFSIEKWQKDRFAIREAYNSQGYIDAQIRSYYKIVEEEPRVRLFYEITENERSYIQRIRITGNVKTKDNVVRRELSFYPGERFNTKEIRESQRRLTNTGFFGDPVSQNPGVSIHTEPGMEPNTRDVVVDVEEGNTGELMLGAGISSNFGLIGNLSFRQRNFDWKDLPKGWGDFFSGNAFAGGGQDLTLRFAPGARRSEYLISFNNPSVFDSPYSFGFTGYIFERQRENFDEDRMGVAVTVGRRITPNLRLALTYGIEDINIGNVDDDAPFDVLGVEGGSTKTYMRFTTVYDKRDNVFFPTKGYRLDASVELADGIFGSSDVQDIKLELRGRYYKTIWDTEYGKHVLSLGGRVGMVDATSGSDVKIFERFFGGGPGTIRGFEFRGVGPHDKRSDDPIGGETLIFTTVEYEFPIVQNVIRGVAFLDSGKIDERISDLDLNDWRASVGMGLRIRLPFFGFIPITLDWGVPLASEAQDDTEVFSFSIGGTL